eukprot:gene10233-7280_t
MTGVVPWALAVTVAVLLQVTTLTLTAAERASYRLPEVRYADLLALEPARLAEAVRYLTETGAVQITGLPRFDVARTRALEDLAECLETEKDAPVAVLPDGARRLSCGASATGGSGGGVSASTAAAASLSPMTSVCGDGAARLRSLVDAGLRQLFYALDAYVATTAAAAAGCDTAAAATPPVLDAQYPTFSSLLTHGAHLEHLHAYVAPTAPPAAASVASASSAASSAASSSSAAAAAATLPLHVDAGLFIGMTTGLYSAQAPLTPAAGLYLQLPSPFDEEVKAEAADDALIVLVGLGAAQWLQPVLGKPLRAMPHALIAGFDTTATANGTATAPATRAWYGKMVLPPADALVGDEQWPFHRYRDAQAARSQPLSRYGDGSGGPSVVDETDAAAAADAASSLWTVLPSACGGAHGGGYVSVMADACASNQVWCWAQCMSAASLSCASPAQYAACYNYRTQAVVSGDSMCMGGDDDAYHGLYCRPTCVNATLPATDDDDDGHGSMAMNVSSASTRQPFCVGRGTTMFMQGFQSMPPPGTGGDAWTSADDASVDCVNLLFDTWTLDTRVKFGFACLGVFLLAAATQALPLVRRWCLTAAWPSTMVRAGGLTLLFGVDKVVGYFVMLVAMTYSAELFAMICLGLTAGYVVFHLVLGDGAEEEKAAGPCCEGGVCHAKATGASSGAAAAAAAAAAGEMDTSESAQRLLSEGHVTDDAATAASSCERGACCGAPSLSVAATAAEDNL